MQLNHKIALVTGGSSGIGKAIARQFANEGATVYITGRRQEVLDDTVREIGENAIGVRTDVSRVVELEALFETIRHRHGRLDVLVANAGGVELARLGEISEEHYERTFTNNVKSVLFSVQLGLPLLVPGASVILTGSATSVTGGEALSVYSATKAAVRNFARSWVQDLKGRQVRVNVLSPGPVRTPALVGLVGNDETLLDGFAQAIPLGRVGEPEEIGRAALFLATDASSFVNGAELFVDGGLAQI
ncbi:SDR family NAD(P)-dependent oxidoreductase [Pseudomonas akapageensis]|uniref:SDR family NAD(P)-dependent oxidoreductase n=1 Tax=Pseudomonas akapageensis TaxID=2609961 RepID=UPI00140D8590|nr:SDR family oxidoreductase [Pseudomonas akapageensis]